MLRLLALLPDPVLKCSLAAALAGTAVGIVLWLAGARFSRSLITLVAVAVGTVIGMRLPAWYGWSIDGIGLAFCGAIVLGVSGYLLHRFWVGATLACILSVWTVLGVWMSLAGEATWDWRAIRWTSDLPRFLSGVWQTLPPNLMRTLPSAGAGAFALGIGLAVFWPKLARVLTYSLLGLSLVVAMGAPALQTSRPQWLGAMPPQMPVQSAILLGLVVIGTLIQWRLTPTLAAPSGGGAPKQDKTAADDQGPAS